MLAAGTIKTGLTFRRSPRGTTGTRKPRHPHPIPDALRANTILVAFCHWAIPIYSLLPNATWEARAKRNHTTPTNEVIRTEFDNFNSNLSIQTNPLITPSEVAPDPPTLTISIRPGSSTPIITADWPYPFDYLTLYRSANPSGPTDLRNLIAILNPYTGPVEHEDRYDLHGTVYYSAIGWYIDAGHTPTATPYALTLP
jgi:hypothetical protein